MQLTVSLTVELGASGGVDEVEGLVLEAGREAVKEALVQACREWEQEVMAQGCPKCTGSAESLNSKGTRRRVVIATFGRAVLHLRRLRCEGCGHKFKPGASFLEGLGGANLTRRLREECAETGSSAPSYKAAARRIHRACGARVNPETVRKYTHLAGTQQAERMVLEAQARHTPTAESVSLKRKQPQQQPQLMVVGLDGGWMLTPASGYPDQPGGMEGKLGVIATAIEPVGLKGRHKLTERVLVGVLACAAALELGGHEASRQWMLGDGAGWIKTQAQQHFGTAVKILDWGHLWRVVAKAVRAARPGQECKRERKRLYEGLREWLWRGQVQEALQVLESLRQAGQQVVALEAAIEYLHHQRHWIGNYEAWQEQGYAVGSGLVERQVELVLNRRLKRRGMRWLRPNADAVLALRLRQLNADWEDQSRPDRAAA